MKQNKKNGFIFTPYLLFHVLICAFNICAPYFHTGSKIVLYETGYHIIFALSFVVMLALSVRKRALRRQYDDAACAHATAACAQAAVFLIYCEVIISVLLLF